MQKDWVHIVGGGLAGLSLARELAYLGRLPGRVVISEARRAYDDDRTFSFWFTASERPYLQPESIHQTWSIGDANTRELMVGNRYRYGTRSAQSFYTEAMQQITEHPDIEWRQETCTTAPTATHVFDSRPPEIEQFQITQSFHGIVAKVSRPHGIQDVSLMDDLKATAHGIRFRYVIPLSPDQVLVEHTEFTSVATDLAVLEQANRAWLDQEFTMPWEHIRTEQAHIPMGIRPIPQHYGQPIGTRAGMARDATGYSYVRTQYWAQQAAFQLVTERRYTPYRAPLSERWMDRLILKLIDERPDCVPAIFKGLARHLEADVFARFMMQQTGIDALKIILASPKKPFFCALMGRCQWI